MGNFSNKNPKNSIWGSVCSDREWDFGNDSRFGNDSKFDPHSKFNHKKPCKVCKSHDVSACECNFKAPARELAAPLNSDCVLVNSVVGSKTVQKVAEATFPFTAFAPVIPAGSTIVSVAVVPNLSGVVRNTTIIRDKVVNIGFIPVTITVTFLAPGTTTPATAVLATNLPFQAHTDFPGACPEDSVIEPPLVVEGIFAQPGVSFVTGTGAVTTDAILVKIVLRTSITVTRQVIVDSHGGICDVNDRRCESTTTPTTNTLPST
ncbi:hypothetical protein Q8G35_06940 [Peribacillus simplex]|uniref:DUF3794 domain-containing protein n=2 Tax=Peribacillus TaxID=2675229 RepID=A0AA90T1V0_9BACI|nr:MULTISPECIES: hypothetical protein [Peribacillus]MDP1418142.1 hypothetical protein [Peribacillus simplex]MDP1451018.1 hypothetical protein [Peribacillus frigoritolerans]